MQKLYCLLPLLFVTTPAPALEMLCENGPILAVSLRDDGLHVAIKRLGEPAEWFVPLDDVEIVRNQYSYYSAGMTIDVRDPVFIVADWSDARLSSLPI